MTSLRPVPAPVAAAAAVPVLELSAVRAGYGRIDVLHGIDIALQPGEVFALLGPNGAGKSTTLAVACGAITPSSGSLFRCGRDVTGAAPDAVARAGVCLIPEGRGIFPNLTVSENLRMATYTGANYHEVLDKAFTQFPRLGERRKQTAGTMSGGEQQMLALSRALVAHRGLLLLDEISMGLAPLVVAELYEFVADLAAQGTTILLTEQFAQTAMKVADYAAVMTHGRITMIGEPADVANAMSSAYLGGSHD